MFSTRKILLVLGMLVLPQLLLAVEVDTAWVRRYNGSGNFFDCAYDIAVDKQYNVYVTGTSVGAGNDYLTIKYNSQGDTLWTRRYNGGYDSEVDCAYAMALDSSGNVIVTGRSVGPDPSFDYLTIKYSPVGETLWVRRYNGPIGGGDEAHAIAVDSSGNIYVTGWSAESESTCDYATIKYSSTGDTLWVRRYGISGYDDKPCAIAIDNSGNIYVTGNSKYDYGTIKYNSAGDTLWVRRYGGTEANDARDIAVDSEGNVYVTGGSRTENGFDYVTIKYTSSGDSLWVRTYNGPKNGFDFPYGGITIDNDDNVYVTGTSSDTAEVVYATIKYSSLGDTLWLRKCGVGTSVQDPYSIAVDKMGNVYVTGESGGAANGDYLTVGYSSTGEELWIQRYDMRGGYERPNAIAVDDSGSVYVTGTSEGWTHYDYATIKYTQTSAVKETVQREYGSLFVISNPIAREIEIRLLSSINKNITISLYDISGRLIHTLFAGKPSARACTRLKFPVQDLNSGVYFLSLQTDEEQEVKKVVVIK